MRLRNPCKECGIPTASIYGMCVKHAGNIATNRTITKKRQAELLTKYNHENGYSLCGV